MCVINAVIVLLGVASDRMHANISSCSSSRALFFYWDVQLASQAIYALHAIDGKPKQHALEGFNSASRCADMIATCLGQDTLTEELVCLAAGLKRNAAAMQEKISDQLEVVKT